MDKETFKDIKNNVKMRKDTDRSTSNSRQNIVTHATTVVRRSVVCAEFASCFRGF